MGVYMLYFGIVGIENIGNEYSFKTGLRLYDTTNMSVHFKGQVTDTNRRLQHAGREVS